MKKVKPSMLLEPQRYQSSVMAEEEFLTPANRNQNQSYFDEGSQKTRLPACPNTPANRNQFQNQEENLTPANRNQKQSYFEEESQKTLKVTPVSSPVIPNTPIFLRQSQQQNKNQFLAASPRPRSCCLRLMVFLGLR